MRPRDVRLTQAKPHERFIQTPGRPTDARHRRQRRVTRAIVRNDSIVSDNIGLADDDDARQSTKEGAQWRRRQGHVHQRRRQLPQRQQQKQQRGIEVGATAIEKATLYEKRRKTKRSRQTRAKRQTAHGVTTTTTTTTAPAISRGIPTRTFYRHHPSFALRLVPPSTAASPLLRRRRRIASPDN
jgi:hypothetical protein